MNGDQFNALKNVAAISIVIGDGIAALLWEFDFFELWGMKILTAQFS